MRMIRNTLALTLLIATQAWAAPAWKAGDKLEIKWGSSWYKGEVVEVDGERYKVRYDGFSSKWDEWTGADRLRPRATASDAPAPATTSASSKASASSAAGATYTFPAAPAGAGGLDGAWLRTESFFMGTSLTLTNHVWFFTANGRVARAPAGGFDPAAFARAESTTISWAGHYRIEGGKLIVDWVDGSKPTAYNYARGPGDEIKIAGIGASRVRPFPAGTRFEGAFAGGASAGGAASSTTLNFSRDGSFSRDSVGSVASTSARSEVSAGAQAQRSGSYAFDGYTLRLTEADGAQQAYTVAAFGKPDSQGRPEYLYIDGGMLARK